MPFRLRARVILRLLAIPSIKEMNSAVTRLATQSQARLALKRARKFALVSTIREVFLQNHASSSRWPVTQKSRIVVSRFSPQAQTAITLCKTMLPILLCKTMLTIVYKEITYSTITKQHYLKE
jgi:hypothetical protein